MTETLGPRCPNDDGNLHQVATHSRLGSPILLDQCDHCGGIWFDKFELFQLDEKEAAGLDSIDKRSLRYPLGATEQPLCPRCRSPLRIFHDQNIPGNVQMLMCGQCEGFWLNHGALAGYADFRQARHPAPDPKLAEQYGKMLGASSDADYWRGVENFGKELGARRDLLTGLRLDGSPAELDRIDRAQDAALILIGTIMRLLFRI